MRPNMKILRVLSQEYSISLSQKPFQVAEMTPSLLLNFWKRKYWYYKNSRRLDQLFLKLFAPSTPLSGLQYRTTFKQQCIKSCSSKHYFHGTCFKEYPINFLMICRLIDFTLVVVSLMFNVYGNFGVWKLEFFNFSITESD